MVTRITQRSARGSAPAGPHQTHTKAANTSRMRENRNVMETSSSARQSSRCNQRIAGTSNVVPSLASSVWGKTALASASVRAARL